jgi:tRNA-dihydrouridine synthase B
MNNPQAPTSLIHAGLKPIQIESLLIQTPIFLAPMAGVTDKPFRQLCQRFGAGVSYSEFVSAEGVVRANERTLDYLQFDDSERPIGIQIFGHHPEVLANAARYIETHYRPDIIDLNFGCPVPKVTKKGGGSAILKDLKRMGEIAVRVKKAVSLPVTAKIRSGWSDKSIVAIDAAQILEESGITLITLHPRTAQMQYKGKADWELIAAVKEKIHIPLIGNGDILTGKDVKAILQETGCDGIMIGRGALGKPWIFQDILNELQDLPPAEHPIVQRFQIMNEHIDALLTHYSSTQTHKLFKTHFAWYVRGLPQAAKFRSEVNISPSLQAMREKIQIYQRILTETEGL